MILSNSFASISACSQSPAPRDTLMETVAWAGTVWKHKGLTRSNYEESEPEWSLAPNSAVAFF